MSCPGLEFPASFLRVSCRFPVGFLRVSRGFLCFLQVLYFPFPKLVFAVRRGFPCVPTLVCSGFPRSFSWLVAGLTRSRFSGLGIAPQGLPQRWTRDILQPTLGSTVLYNTFNLLASRTHFSNLLASLTRLSPSPFFKPFNLWRNTTPLGVEPLRAEPNEFRVHLLSRSGRRCNHSCTCANVVGASLTGQRHCVRAAKEMD